jgi:hypothetical protein
MSKNKMTFIYGATIFFNCFVILFFDIEFFKHFFRVLHEASSS